MTTRDPLYAIVDGHAVLISTEPSLTSPPCPHYRVPSSRLCNGCRESIEYEGTGLRECAPDQDGECGCEEEE